MSVKIRNAVLDSDKTQLVAFLKRYLTNEWDESRFEWLYRQCPHGQARCWVAVEGENGAIIGTAAAFARRFHFRGTTKFAWVLGDFCLGNKYRALGPALQLQRACLEAVTAPYDFCYDFPNKAMMAIYERLGFRQTCNLVRWARPLRSDHKLESVLRSKGAARVLGKVADVLLDLRGRKSTNACDVELHEGACGEEFSDLDQLLGGDAGVTMERTAEYLNWRYLSHPSKTYEILVARGGTALVGYLVVQTHSEIARIVDIVSPNEPAVIVDLINSATHLAKRRGGKSISLTAADRHPWSGLFEQAGFVRRECAPIVVIVREGATLQLSEIESGCHLMEGDRDS